MARGGVAEGEVAVGSGSVCGLCGWGQGDVVAESLELADVVVFAGVRVGVVAAEVIGAKVMESGLGILQEMPDDDEDGPSDGDDGTLFASASGDSSVAFA